MHVHWILRSVAGRLSQVKKKPFFLLGCILKLIFGDGPTRKFVNF
jgi:hypothetical protein